MRKIARRLTSCYYPSWKHSHSAPANCTPLELLDVCSPCLAAVLPEHPPTGLNTLPPAWAPSHRAWQQTRTAGSAPVLPFILFPKALHILGVLPAYIVELRSVYTVEFVSVSFYHLVRMVYPILFLFTSCIVYWLYFSILSRYLNC
jgi:hypothetical protein